MKHTFQGKWITDSEFFDLKPRNVFHKQLDKVDLPCDKHRNRHVLFRKAFNIIPAINSAKIFISADDYYKLYINGQFVSQGPAPNYHSNYCYNEINVAKYLKQGENIIAVHTLYQGLINRVWQSGDNRHGLILDLVVNGQVVVSSDESFKTAIHTAYTEIGVCGYDTQFLEQYDSNALEVGFESCNYNDDYWQNARIRIYDDYVLNDQKSSALEFENILPTFVSQQKNSVVLDFGSIYVGYLCLTATGNKNDAVTIRCGQELNDDGSVRYQLRANCNYEELWLLSDKTSYLDWFDYKTFRYVEILFPDSVELTDIYLKARHYPFNLKVDIKPEYAGNEDIKKVWDLCVRSQKYGVQEVIQDCMEREKGFYLGDGCYTALTNMILTGDDSMVKKLIDDAFFSQFISDTLITCLDCSAMQEIAEFPLILVYLVLWHYNYTQDKKYLAQNYPKIVKLLEAYRKNYEQDFLLKNLDKWCVVEWPMNYRHGYDAKLVEGEICKDAHISINAYYIAAIKATNNMARILDKPCYRDITPLKNAFTNAFYDKKTCLFKDGENTEHISLVGNSFVYGLGVCSQPQFKEAYLNLYQKWGIHSLALFCTFPVLMGFVQDGQKELLEQAITNENAWKRILREGGTTTFEGWGKDTKWNTSLFHLTMTYVATFIADTPLDKIFDGMLLEE